MDTTLNKQKKKIEVKIINTKLLKPHASWRNAMRTQHHFQDIPAKDSQPESNY